MSYTDLTNADDQEFIRLTRYLDRVVPGKVLKLRKWTYLGDFTDDPTKDGLASTTSTFHPTDSIFFVVSKTDTDLSGLLGAKSNTFMITTVVLWTPMEKLGFTMIFNGNKNELKGFFETFELIE